MFYNEFAKSLMNFHPPTCTWSHRWLLQPTTMSMPNVHPPPNRSTEASRATYFRLRIPLTTSPASEKSSSDESSAQRQMELTQQRVSPKLPIHRNHKVHPATKRQHPEFIGKLFDINHLSYLVFSVESVNLSTGPGICCSNIEI